MNTRKMKIGFVGLGIMGSRMAANLLKEGHELVVYNRSIDKAQLLVDQGASVAKNVKDLATQVDLVFTMLSTPTVVRKTAAELLPNLRPDSWWVDCSTVNPSFSREMAQLSKTHGVNFIDAPVAGSKAPAENGELLFLAGGLEKNLKPISPYLDSMGKKTIFLNEIGNGANMKMLINLMLAQSMATFSEAIALGKGMGLHQELLLNIMTATPVVSPVMGLLKDRLVAENFDVNFPLKWIHKDILLALETAEEVGVPMPSLNQTEILYRDALDKDLGELDFSAIYKSLVI
ncbi:NAD(P)-dependent oxidoreductase [Roseivirga sp. E12]|uniref:NAD(P)-dependent oxidoreductase n=1 Tax=Roseivirga sp. E12 TaxID=2819237 RepID=UPI001ABC2CBE|nr:NAD(P)-dependent oxidoreductase [Roseivirga sp. E12]